MIPNAWRTDHDGWDPDDRPSPSDLADEPTGRDIDPGQLTTDQQQHRLALLAQVIELQVPTNARHTRCATCNTSIDLEWDGELCDHGQPLCAGCHCNCPDGAA